jgi:hypothetical protein
MAAASATRLSWLIRIEEAENLLRARSAELDNRIAIRRGLEQELQQHSGLQASDDAAAQRPSQHQHSPTLPLPKQPHRPRRMPCWSSSCRKRRRTPR